jgi:hypothetical protein
MAAHEAPPPRPHPRHHQRASLQYTDRRTSAGRALSGRQSNACPGPCGGGPALARRCPLAAGAEQGGHMQSCARHGKGPRERHPRPAPHVRRTAGRTARPPARAWCPSSPWHSQRADWAARRVRFSDASTTSKLKLPGRPRYPSTKHCCLALLIVLLSVSLPLARSANPIQRI